MRRNWELFRNFGLEAIPIVKIRESLLKDSKLDQNYLILILSSCLIATFGLLINSAAGDYWGDDHCTFDATITGTFFCYPRRRCQATP